MNTCSQPVDNLSKTRRNPVQVIHNLTSYLTEAVRCHRVKRAAEADCSRSRMQLMGGLCLLVGLLSQTTILNAQAVGIKSDKDYYKLYAHSRIINLSLIHI